jgi:hypothetical protein
MADYNNISLSRLTSFAFLMYAVLTVGVVGAAESTAGVGEGDVTTSLSQLSYPNGITFDDSTLPQEHTLSFPLPLDTAVENPILRLVYRGTTTLTSTAALEVSIGNGAAKKLAVPNDGDSHVWQIPLDSSALRSPLLKVKLRGVIPVAYDHCVDMKPDSGQIHIAATSAMSLTYKSTPTSPRDAWLLLPKQVTISVPAGTLDQALFRTALEWTTLLERQHHSVRIARLPELGQLVIAPASEIATALGMEPSTPLWSDQSANIGLIAGQTRPVIALTEPYANAQRFLVRWRELKEPAFLENQAPPQVKMPAQIALATVGIPGTQAWMGHKLGWNGQITPWNLPPATRPLTANLQVELPDMGAADPLRLYAYLDGRLVSTALVASTEPKTVIKVPFDVLHKDNTYRLRIVLRKIAGSDCQEPQGMVPVKMDSNSRIVVQDDPDSPEMFYGMPTALGRGFDLYLPRSYLSKAESILPDLGHLLAGFSVPPDNYLLILYDDAPHLEPYRLFIAMGDRLPADSDAPLHFDQGKTRVVDQNNTALLSEQQLEKMSTIQMVTINNVNGLWLHSGKVPGLPELNALQLGASDLAIFDPDHLVLTLNSHEEDLARIQYIDSPRWFDRLYKQRLIWLGVAWLLLTAGILYLHIKSRQHRRI